MNPQQCIFCLSDKNPPSEEHIFPQSLVGNRDFLETADSGETRQLRFVLENGEVCIKCNGALSPLDDWLQQQLGVLKVFWNPVGTKRGNPASAARPGLYAVRGDDGPHISINAEQHAVLARDGTTVPPTSGRPRSVHSIAFNPEAGEGSFAQPIAIEKRFVRAVYKIAFETLCLLRGPEKVLDSRYNGLRAYVLTGRGKRHIALPRNLSPSRSEGVAHPSVSIQRIRYSFDYFAVVQLGLPFGIDLSPDEEVRWGSDLVKVSDKQRVNLTLDLRMRGKLEGVEDLD